MTEGFLLGFVTGLLNSSLSRSTAKVKVVQLKIVNKTFFYESFLALNKRYAEINDELEFGVFSRTYTWPSLLFGI